MLEHRKVFLKSLNVCHCGSEQCKPNHSFGPAVRRQYLLHFVESGTGTYCVNGETYPLHSGQAFLIYPGEVTTYSASNDNPWKYIWVGFDGLEADDAVQRMTVKNRYVIDVADCERFKKYLYAIVDSFVLSGEYGVLEQFYGALNMLCTPFATTQNEQSDRYLLMAQEYIQYNYINNLQISEVAAYVGIDRTYLYKIFRRETEMSPKEYLQFIRINAAKKMLDENKYSVTEVALSCGFPNAAAFSACFKKSVGRTATQYMKCY